MPVWLAAAALSAGMTAVVVSNPDRRDPNYHGPRPPAIRADAPVTHLARRSKSHRLHVVRRVAK